MQDSKTTYQLFAEMSPRLFKEFLDFFYTQEKEAINMAVQTMAINRKLRPIFVKRKPPEQRYAWLKKELGKKYSQTISDNLLQTWFMESQSEMLNTFLDELGVEHDERGEVDELPESVQMADLKKATEAILKGHEAEKVTLYLETILAMGMAEWPEVRELIDSDERLYLGEQPPAPANPAKTETETETGPTEKQAVPAQGSPETTGSMETPMPKDEKKPANPEPEEHPAKGKDPKEDTPQETHKQDEPVKKAATEE
jgi:hypothetical protein